MNTTLRTRLLLAIFGTIAVALCAIQYVQYSMIRQQLYEEFDQHLGARARALAVMIEQDRDVIDIEFRRNPMQEFARAIRPEYYQIWHEDGQVLARSRQLQSNNLPQFAGDMVQPLIREVVLPDGRSGRGVGIRFQPHVDGESLDITRAAGSGRDGHVAGADTDDAYDEDAIDFSRRVHVTLVVARDTQDVQDSLASLARLLIGSGLAAGMIIPTVLAWLVTSSLKPLQALARQIGDVDEQNLSQRFELTDAPGELQPVVFRLNALMQRLEDAFLREKTFTADVAHELRTPLAGIRSTLEVGLSRHRDSESYRSAMECCLRISEETETVIATLFSLSQLEAGQVTLEYDVVGVDDFLRRRWLPFAARADQNHVTVAWETDSRCFLNTDPGRLQVVLSNLFDNAVSYVENGGRIRITAGCDDTSLRIQVTNTGCLLSKDQILHVFDRFWRADVARSATGSHSGLGLALTHRIVEVLNGSIQATVENNDFTVVVILPSENVEFVDVPLDEDCSIRPGPEALRRHHLAAGIGSEPAN